MSASSAPAALVPVGSSGSVLADKRYAYAEALAAEGDFVAAADLFGQAAEAAPGWAAALLAQGLALERLGDLPGAQDALAAAAALDRSGVLGVGPQLHRLQGVTPSGMAPAYIAALFDQYASRFDAHLVGSLGYRGPQIVADALADYPPAERFVTGLDLGCGTGLMGRTLSRPGLSLDGIDLSAAMLKQAEATGCYRDLRQGDCVAVARGLPAGSYGMAVAADVLVYLGDLDPLCAAVARLLEPGGVFAATVQTGAGDGYELGPDLRFRHGAAYIQVCLERAGFADLRMRPCVTRRENGAEVPGLVFVGRRT